MTDPTVSDATPPPDSRCPGILKRTLSWSCRFAGRFLFGGPRWRRALVWTVVLAALLVGAGFSVHQWQAAKAREHFRKGNHDDAIACWTNCIRLYPWDRAIYLWRALAWSKKKG